MSKFKIGDTVQLKSGGPKMTCTQPSQDQPSKVYTNWFIGPDLKRGSFHEDELILCADSPAPTDQPPYTFGDRLRVTFLGHTDTGREFSVSTVRKGDNLWFFGEGTIGSVRHWWSQNEVELVEDDADECCEPRFKKGDAVRMRPGEYRAGHVATVTGVYPDDRFPYSLEFDDGASCAVMQCTIEPCSPPQEEDPKFKFRDVVRYKGDCQSRVGQTARIIGVDGSGFIIKFADGVVYGCFPSSLDPCPPDDFRVGDEVKSDSWISGVNSPGTITKVEAGRLFVDSVVSYDLNPAFVEHAV